MRIALWIFIIGFFTGWMMQAICSDADWFMGWLVPSAVGYLALLSWGEAVREWGKDL